MSSDYHSDYSRVSKTMLNKFADSALMFAHYYVWKDVPVPGPKKEMIVGSAGHKVLLERFAIEDCVATYPDSCLKKNGAINPKPAGEFVAANAGKFVMKAKDSIQLAAMCEAVRKHELGALITHPEAVFEQPKFWTCETTGMGCRLMADFYLDTGDEIVAYDLKTTESAHPAAVKRTARQLRYWLQDAHYSTGLSAIFGKPVRFRFWFVETKFPFRIAPYEYSDIGREIGGSLYRGLMKQLAERYRTQDWRDDWTIKVNPLHVDEDAIYGVDVDEEVAYVGEE